MAWRYIWGEVIKGEIVQQWARTVPPLLSVSSIVNTVDESLHCCCSINRPHPWRRCADTPRRPTNAATATQRDHVGANAWRGRWRMRNTSTAHFLLY